MNASTEPGRPEGPDEIDGLFDAARELAQRPRPEQALDWGRVWGTARRRQTRRVVLAGSFAAIVAGAGVALAFLAARAPEDRPSATRQPIETMVAGAEEYRLLRPDPRVQVVAERDAVLRVVSANEIALDAGGIWVRVDASDGPVPFDVVAPDARISVLGTRFAVLAVPGAPTSVAVLEGRVRVRAGAEDVVLGAGREWRRGSGAPVDLSDARRSALEGLLGGQEQGPSACPAVAGSAPAGAGATTTAASADHPAAPDAPGGTAAPNPHSTSERADAIPGADAASAASVPSEAEELYREAEQAMALGRFDEAARLLERVAGAVPGTALGGTALMDLGARLRQLGRADEAAEAYRRYLAEQPAGPYRGEARITLCRIGLRAGRNDEARACYAAYLEELPTGPYAEEAARGAAGEEAR